MNEDDSRSQTDVLGHALALAQIGWPVLPVREQGKEPLTSKGLKDASTDESTISIWFSNNPERNIGVRTGRESGTVVIDIDKGSGGYESLASFERKFGQLPKTVTAKTGGGGKHYIFARPDIEKVPGPVRLAGMAGIDVRADGNYIVVAPSLHSSGARYEWEDGRSPWDLDPAPLPPHLIELILTHPSSKKSSGKKTKPIVQLIEIEPGNRNESLFRYACSQRAKGHGREEVQTKVAEQNTLRCKPPLEESEIEKIVASAMRYEPSTHFNCSDLGNAKRLVAQHGRDIRYCHDFKRWLIWNGTRWDNENPARIVQLATETALNIAAEAERCSDPDVAEDLHKWAIRSQSRLSIDNLIALSRSEVGIPVRPDDLDKAIYLFNVENGTIDLRTGDLREHRREDMITRQAAIRFNADAKCPEFFRFLDRILPDKECVGFLQRALGYSLTGDVKEQCLFLLYGSGANGKSTLLNAVRDASGPYAKQTPTETLLAKTFGGGVPNDIARLKGARFVTASEVDDGRRMAEGLIKQMTGGEPMSARFMRAEFFEFLPEFKIFLATNRRPHLDGGDPAIWRRIHQVPFSVTIPENERDPELKNKLLAEREGILAWLVRGAVEWFKNGLQVPAAVKAATEEYRREMDLIGVFLDELCEVGDDFETEAGRLYIAYTGWCKESGSTSENQKVFGGNLTRRGFKSVKKGKMHRRGLRLIGDGLHAPSSETGIKVSEDLVPDKLEERAREALVGNGEDLGRVPHSSAGLCAP